MKLKFVAAKTLYEATKVCLKQIDNTNLDERNLVVVPDAFSMQAENLVFEALNIKSTFNIDVVGISRIASKLLRENNIMYDRVSGLEEILFVYKAIKQNENEFLYFKSYGVDFAVKVLDILKSFSNSNLDPEDITECDDILLSKKMHDLKLIYESYLKLLDDRLNLTKLLEFFLEKIDGIENINLYFVNFDSFSSEIFDFICQLSEKVKSVTIALAKSTGSQNAYIYDIETQEKLFEFAKNNNLAVSVIESKTELSAPKKGVLDNVFSINQTKGKLDGVYVVESKSEKDEAEFVAKYIRYHVVNSQKRFKDFAVAVSGEEYYPILKSILNRYEIPFYMDYTLSLGEVAISKFLLKMFDIALLGSTKGDFEYLVSNPFLNIENSEDIIQSIEFYEIDDKKQFKKHFSVLDDVFKLVDSLKDSKTLREYCQNTLDILDVIEGNLEAYLSKISFDIQKQSENKQSFDLCKKIFNNISEFKYDEEMSLKDFIFLINNVFSGIKIETVPSYIDAVYIGEVTKSYFQDVDSFFVLGATADKLPKTEKDSGLINDDEINKLNYKNKIEPEIRIKNRRNRLKLFEVLQHFKEELFILTPVGNGSKKAGFVEDLINCATNNIVLQKDSIGVINTSDKDQNAEKILFELGARRVSEENYNNMKLDIPIEYRGEIERYIKDNVYNFDYDADLTQSVLRDKISATELETYFNCPFKRFVSYGLNIKEPEKAKEDKAKTGSLKHLLAEWLVKDYGKKIKTLKDEDIKDFLDKKFILACKECYDETTLENKIFIKLLRSECHTMLSNIVYEISNSDFEIKQAEKFVSTKIKNLKLNGKIDRVDTYGNYFRIVDYKTGEVASLVKDLAYGKKIQLFLYGSIAAKEMGKICSGVYYFDCKNKFKKKNTSGKLLTGLTLREDEVFEASDTRLKTSMAKSDIIGASRLKTPKVDFSFNTRSATQGFDKYFDYVTKLCDKAVEEMEKGYYAPKPLDNACEFCPYNSICKYNSEDCRKQKSKEI